VLPTAPRRAGIAVAVRRATPNAVLASVRAAALVPRMALPDRAFLVGTYLPVAPLMRPCFGACAMAPWGLLARRSAGTRAPRLAAAADAGPLAFVPTREAIVGARPSAAGPRRAGGGRRLTTGVVMVT
jgi:hypothetical protein